jgi:hypothetical protein
MATGPKTALLKGMFKEVLRTLKEDGTYLQAQADQQLTRAGGAAAAAAAWGAQPDAHRALARLRGALAGGRARAAWDASKQRARARLQQAYAAVGRRYEEALGGAGGPEPAGALGKELPSAAGAAAQPEQLQQQPAAAADPQLRELYGADDWARVRARGDGRACCGVAGRMGEWGRAACAPRAAWAPHAPHAPAA